MLLYLHQPAPSPLQKSLLGLVQGASCRVEVEFKDADGKPYKKVAVVKSKLNETEELALFTNKDNMLGEVGGRLWCSDRNA